MIAAAIMWSTSGLFAKAPMLHTWPVESRGIVIAFWRAVFASGFLLPFVRRPKFHAGLVPATLIFAAMNVTYLNAMARTSAANAIWLQSISPVWVFAIGVLVLREPAVRRDWIMLVAASTGVGFILLFELTRIDGSATSTAGVYWGLSSGVLLATVIISLRLLRDFDAVWLIALNLFVTAAVLAPFVISRQPLPTVTQLVWLCGFGVFQMGVPYVLFAQAVRSIPGHEAAFLVLLEPVLVPLWVWLAWHNHSEYIAPSWWTLVGGGLILAGLISRYGLDTLAGTSRTPPRRGGAAN